MGDRTKAEALRLAHILLEKKGWKYTAKKVGEVAREILDGMEGKSNG